MLHGESIGRWIPSGYTETDNESVVEWATEWYKLELEERREDGTIVCESEFEITVREFTDLSGEDMWLCIPKKTKALPENTRITIRKARGGCTLSLEGPGIADSEAIVWVAGWRIVGRGETLTLPRRCRQNLGVIIYGFRFLSLDYLSLEYCTLD